MGKVFKAKWQHNNSKQDSYLSMGFNCFCHQGNSLDESRKKVEVYLKKKLSLDTKQKQRSHLLWVLSTELSLLVFHKTFLQPCRLLAGENNSGSGEWIHFGRLLFDDGEKNLFQALGFQGWNETLGLKTFVSAAHFLLRTCFWESENWKVLSIVYRCLNKTRWNDDFKRESVKLFSLFCAEMFEWWFFTAPAGS